MSDKVKRNKYGGDWVGGDKFEGDKVMGRKFKGDKVMGGESYSVGDISNSSGVAIGHGANAGSSLNEAKKQMRSLRPILSEQAIEILTWLVVEDSEILPYDFIELALVYYWQNME